jgi:hypothetical protein
VRPAPNEDDGSNDRERPASEAQKYAHPAGPPELWNPLLLAQVLGATRAHLRALFAHVRFLAAARAPRGLGGGGGAATARDDARDDGWGPRDDARDDGWGPRDDGWGPRETLELIALLCARPAALARALALPRAVLDEALAHPHPLVLSGHTASLTPY